MNNTFYAFGDIHGELDKLDNLVKRTYFDRDSTLIFLGDYIDRGKKSFEVVEYLINLSKEFNCVFIRGNHENMFLDYLRGINENIYLMTCNGGKKTLKSYYKHGYSIQQSNYYLYRRLPVKHVEFFQNLKRYYETEDYIFVHAGVDPKKPLEETSDETLLWDVEFSNKTYEGKTVVYGHVANNKILNEKYKICIDTGAGYKSMGDLTCVKLPDRIFKRQGGI